MTKEEKKRYTRIVILLLIILLLIFLILIRLFGKIGYVETSNNFTDAIYVTEDDIGWDLLEELNIFRNIKYDNKNKIAPGSYGTYSFLITNATDVGLIYDIQLREINKYGINMKYKLKLENVYISGDKTTWKDLEEINTENIIVAPNSTNFYTLEWYWEHNDVQDTQIGQLNYADYTVRIKVGAQIYDKTVGGNI